jgi:hypothetical protein
LKIDIHYLTILINCPPEAYRFASDSDAALSKKIFNDWSGTPAVAEIESIVQPDGVGNDIAREPLAFVSIDAPIITTMGSYL